jgi:hypothetical protein
MSEIIATPFKKVMNQVTGKPEMQFGAVLESIGTKAYKYTPETGPDAGVEKSFFLGNVSFVAPNGVVQKNVMTQISAKSIANGMTVGKQYLSSLSKDDEGRLWIRTSSAIYGATLDATAFADLDWTEVPVEANAVQATV